jgi:acyl-CoA reductase-like NAD-dependent aldehyde dehydrogenase
VSATEFVAIDPATGERTRFWPAHTRDEVGARLAGAQAAFEDWRRVPVAERAAVLGRIADEMEARTEDLALLATCEMGKPIRESRAEVAKCVGILRHYAVHAPAGLAPVEVATEAARSFVRFDPLGVVLAIMPWNFPYSQVVRAATTAIAAGDTVLLKHAPTTMGTGEAFAELCTAAGLPDGVFTTLRVDTDVAADVIADDRVRGVAFTGSTGAGRSVAALAAAAGKPTLLELGGSDPFVVLEDADVARAAATAVTARFVNAGQSCIAAKRFVVHRAVADAFTAAVQDAMAGLVVGDPRDEATTLGPVARADLRDQLADQVARSVAAGAEPVITGGIRSGPGFFFAPALLRGVSRDHAVGGEETFGPAAAILVADSDDHAVELANDTRYGLGASIWTGDRARGEALAERLEAGVVGVNATERSDPRLPFGGVKDSGYGRELGVEGLRAFVNIKSVWAED